MNHCIKALSLDQLAGQPNAQYQTVKLPANYDKHWHLALRRVFGQSKLNIAGGSVLGGVVGLNALEVLRSTNISCGLEEVETLFRREEVTCFCDGLEERFDSSCSDTAKMRLELGNAISMGLRSDL